MPTYIIGGDVTGHSAGATRVSRSRCGPPVRFAGSMEDVGLPPTSPLAAMTCYSSLNIRASKRRSRL